MASSSRRYALDFLSFLNASPTPFHAVEAAKQRLVKAGFTEIKERDSWVQKVKKGGRYFLTRNGSTLVAFGVGKKWQPGNGMAMIGAHTDSPALRVKPVSKRFAEKDTFLQVGVETYGGGLWHTWFDRDLSVAGRALVRREDGKIVARLVKIDTPILRIPTLAIHLDRNETFSFNKETQLFPIAGLAAAALNEPSPKVEEGKALESEESVPEESGFEPLAAMVERHHPAFVDLIASAAHTEVDKLLDFEMILYDTQPSVLGGLDDEFIFSGRLDNLTMSYCATVAIIESLDSSDALEDEEGIRLISLFDHEEIGSLSAQGAHSNILPALIRRLSTLTGDGTSTSTAYEQTLIKSMLWSCDMAHGVHPNYPAKYESHHRPQMNKGVVIKVNANARYATNSPGIILTEEIAREAGVPLQLFVVRNDSSCGGTIGPMLSAALGSRTIDMGNPQLSMHSIRETGGAVDVEYAVRFFRKYFERYSKLEGKILVDGIDLE